MHNSILTPLFYLLPNELHNNSQILCMVTSTKWHGIYLMFFFFFVHFDYLHSNEIRYAHNKFCWTKYERKHDANETTLQKIYYEKKTITYIKFVCIGSFDLISDWLFETHFSMHAYVVCAMTQIRENCCFQNYRTVRLIASVNFTVVCVSTMNIFFLTYTVYTLLACICKYICVVI